jgi:DNA-binding Lrp family transcriptional regulator
MLTKLEKKVIAAIQGDMPIAEQPYVQIAQELKIDESLLIKTLNDLVQRGIMRRFGATLRHQKSGFKANAMTAWQVNEDRIDAVGNIMAGFKEVSHCYRRDPKQDWPYNLYTMIHGLDEQHCRKTAKKMAAKAGVDRYCLLFSRREFKKTSMKYFNESDSDNLN